MTFFGCGIVFVERDMTEDLFTRTKNSKSCTLWNRYFCRKSLVRRPGGLKLFFFPKII